MAMTISDGGGGGSAVTTAKPDPQDDTTAPNTTSSGAPPSAPPRADGNAAPGQTPPADTYSSGHTDHDQFNAAVGRSSSPSCRNQGPAVAAQTIQVQDLQFSQNGPGPSDTGRNKLVRDVQDAPAWATDNTVEVGARLNDYARDVASQLSPEEAIALLDDRAGLQDTLRANLTGGTPNDLSVVNRDQESRGAYLADTIVQSGHDLEKVRESLLNAGLGDQFVGEITTRLDGGGALEVDRQLARLRAGDFKEGMSDFLGEASEWLETGINQANAVSGAIVSEIEQIAIADVKNDIAASVHMHVDAAKEHFDVINASDESRSYFLAAVVDQSGGDPKTVRAILGTVGLEPDTVEAVARNLETSAALENGEINERLRSGGYVLDDSSNAPNPEDHKWATADMALRDASEALQLGMMRINTRLDAFAAAADAGGDELLTDPLYSFARAEAFEKHGIPRELATAEVSRENLDQLGSDGLGRVVAEHIVVGQENEEAVGRLKDSGLTMLSVGLAMAAGPAGVGLGVGLKARAHVSLAQDLVGVRTDVTDAETARRADAAIGGVEPETQAHYDDVTQNATVRTTRILLDYSTRFISIPMGDAPPLMRTFAKKWFEAYTDSKIEEAFPDRSP